MDEVEISRQEWLDILKDKEVTNNEVLNIIKEISNTNEALDINALCEEYGHNSDYYNDYINSFGKAIVDNGDCGITENEDGSVDYFSVMFRKENNKYYLRDELVEAVAEYGAIEIADIFKMPKNYWILNQNSDCLEFESIMIRKPYLISLKTFTGKNRVGFELVTKMSENDLVFGINNNCELSAICKVHAITPEGLYIEKIEQLNNKIKLNESSVFSVGLTELPKDQYENLIDIVREHNPIINKTYNSYTEDNFLNDVYMERNNYIELKNLLMNKKNIILEGPPGVGKTFSATRLAYAILGEKNTDCIAKVQFHQNYSYEDFVIGYKPNESGFELRTGVFYNFCQKAINNPENKYFFIIDEINRGNLSKVFGELLMLIENDYRGSKNAIRLAYTGKDFYVPENLYIIGMMNTADRSLAMIDYALRRRFSFYKMSPGFNSQGFKNYANGLQSNQLDNLVATIIQLNNEIENDLSLGEGFKIGHSYLCGLKDVTQEQLESIIKYDIVPTLKEYWFDSDETWKNWESKLLDSIR